MFPIRSTPPKELNGPDPLLPVLLLDAPRADGKRRPPWAAPAPFAAPLPRPTAPVLALRLAPPPLRLSSSEVGEERPLLLVLPVPVPGRARGMGRLRPSGRWMEPMRFIMREVTVSCSAARRSSSAFSQRFTRTYSSCEDQKRKKKKKTLVSTNNLDAINVRMKFVNIALQKFQI